LIAPEHPDRSASARPLLDVENLAKTFPMRHSLARRVTGAPPLVVHALNGVTFAVERGETLGIVGESGCGKSTLARCLVRLIEPDSGRVRFDGEDVLAMSRGELRAYNRRVQMIFQDPYGSLNPRMTVGQILGEALAVHRMRQRAAIPSRIIEILSLVGLPAEAALRRPHAFSGGQRQRIGIARALAVEPECLIADELVSALDVSVQAQVVNLLAQLQSELGLAYIFIAHDLSVVRHISDRVGVMYLGKLVELGDEDQIYSRPTHPYTQALLSAVPLPDPTMRNMREQIVLTGDVPSPANPPKACRFHTRCWKAQEICSIDEPLLIERPDGESSHVSACHFAEPRVIL